MLIKHIADHGGRFFENNAGYSLAIGKRKIPLSMRPDNLDVARLLIAALNLTANTPLGRAVVLRLMVHASTNCEKMAHRSFAAMVSDSIYVPVNDGRLVQITSSGAKQVENGSNQDAIWVDHPFDNAFSPLSELPPDAVIQQGLKLFEELLVDTQACGDEMGWFTAINGALLPFVRDILDARFLLVHTGGAGSGKTTGARRFLRLLGLADVHGDYSLAALGNQTDPGFLVLDNREQRDVDRPMMNYLLYLATGADRARSDREGNIRRGDARPIAHLTSIEGMHSEELRRRCVDVSYQISGRPIASEPTDQAILRSRSVIFGGMAAVLSRFLNIRGSKAAPSPARVAGFPGHFAALCDLLRAFGDVSSRGRAWADSVVERWVRVLDELDGAEDQLESLIKGVALSGSLGMPVQANIGGQNGSLYCTDASALHRALRSQGDPVAIPVSPSGLGRRIKNSRFVAIQAVDSSTAPGLKQLERTRHHRPLGIFIPPDALGPAAPCDNQTLGPPTPEKLSLLNKAHEGHCYVDWQDDCRFIWEYVPGKNDCIRAFVSAFKTSLVRRSDGTACLKKASAIEHAARALQPLLPSEWRRWAFVPIPPSIPLGEVGYDSRLATTLDLVRPPLDVRSILNQVKATVSCAKGLPPNARASLMALAANKGDCPPGIVLFDDILASGSHFSAAKSVLRKSFPDIPIVGLFLARSCLQPLALAAHGGA